MKNALHNARIWGQENLTWLGLAAATLIAARLATLAWSDALLLRWPDLLLQDSIALAGMWSAVLIALLIGPAHPLYQRLSRSFLIVFFMIMMILSRKYYSLYESEFAWFHLGQDKGAGGLWFSIQAELNWRLYTPLTMAVMSGVLYFHYQTRQIKRWISRSNGLLPQTQAQYKYLHVLGLCLAAAWIALFWHQKKTQWHPELHDDGNVLLRILYIHKLPLQSVAIDAGPSNPEAFESDPRFQYKWPARSITATQRLAPLEKPQTGRKPNIVLYFFESTAKRYLGHLDPGGQAITPTWDYLYQHGLGMQNHYANNPLSINALFNVLVSAYPLPLDRWAARDYPDIKLQDLSQVLHQHGYRTAVYHSGYLDYAGAGTFLNQRQFDEILDISTLRKEGLPIVNWGIDDRAMIQPALRFIQKDTTRPFFQVLLPVSPHHPYETPTSGPRISVPTALQDGRGQAFHDYLNSLHYSDQILGAVLLAYQKAKLLQNTIFFIFADHGEAFGQHPRNYNHPFYVFEENVHVPFVVFSPGLIAPGNVARITSHLDIMPTILDLLDIECPEHAEGVSIFKSGEPRYAALHTTWRNRLIGLRDQNYKYIYNQVNGRSALFDLSIDPLEQTNIARDKTELVNTYRFELARLEVHQRQFYQQVIGKPIDWNATTDKENF
ncbi:MAG: LTA synthase family protein [Leptospiraceae bacterium]|nr:LTA synthase family protein [Leptospiraceae bacterium]